MHMEKQTTIIKQRQLRIVITEVSTLDFVIQTCYLCDSPLCSSNSSAGHCSSTHSVAIRQEHVPGISKTNTVITTVVNGVLEYNHHSILRFLPLRKF